MTTTTLETTRERTPWRLWAVGFVGLLWNGFGAYDYVMTNTGGVEYLRELGFTAAQIAYFEAMPAWATAVWAIGVWGAVLGAILLLAKSRFALHAYLASLGAFLLSLVYSFGLSNGLKVMGAGPAAMNAVILAGCLFFVWYARRMVRAGVLR